MNNYGPYHYGDVVQLTAVSTVGWSFQSWGGDIYGSTSPTTITIDGNKAVTATFSLVRAYIDPALTEKTVSYIGTSFQVSVKITGSSSAR